MNFNTEVVNNATIISVEPNRLDASIAPELKEEVAGSLSAGTAKLIIDLSNVEFMDSSGLGAIIASFKLSGDSCEFLLCNLQAPVQDIFKLTHMDRVFDINIDLDEQLQKKSA